jgi:hypothetical protein
VWSSISVALLQHWRNNFTKIAFYLCRSFFQCAFSILISHNFMCMCYLGYVTLNHLQHVINIVLLVLFIFLYLSCRMFSHYVPHFIHISSSMKSTKTLSYNKYRFFWFVDKTFNSKNSSVGVISKDQISRNIVCKQPPPPPPKG